RVWFVCQRSLILECVTPGANRAGKWQTAAAAFWYSSCCRGPASLTLQPARTTRCSLRSGAEYLECIPNRSFDPGAAAAKSQHRNHLGHDLVVSAQLLIGGQPPDQSHEIRRAALCDGGSQWNRAQCGAVKAKTEIPVYMSCLQK